MLRLIKKVQKYGLRRSTDIAVHLLKARTGYLAWQHRRTPIYLSPTEEELVAIEESLAAMGVKLHDYFVPPDSYHVFQREAPFPNDYHGGSTSLVWREKLLEHWISQDLLHLKSFDASDTYVDIAAASSPWAKIQREIHGLNAFANDLISVGEDYSHLDYYRVEDATASAFRDASVMGASLHCAFEMFSADDDIALMRELGRILKPGGKAVILPLYLHTHYCAYATPEYYAKGYSDPEAKEYIRLDCRGIPSSRKYSPEILGSRVLKTIEEAALQYKLYVLRNKKDLGEGVYCHFILEIQK